MAVKFMDGVRLLVVTVASVIPLQSSAQERANHGVERSDEVVIEHAEIVLSPSPAGMAAGYLTVFNGTDQEVGLSSVATAFYGNVSLHKTEMEDGVVRMRPVDGSLRIPQGTELLMRPGGVHLMLMEPKGDLTAGGNIALEVKFADGSTETVDAAVLEPGQRPTDHHHGDDEEAGQ